MSCRMCDVSSSAMSPCLDCAANIEKYKQMIAPVPTAYDRAQAENEQRLKKLEALKIQTDARFDNALRRIEALELDVARLKAYPTANAERIRQAVAEHNWDEASKVQPSPATAYPPLPDEGT